MVISSGNGFASMLAPFGGGTSYSGTPRRGRHTYAVGGKIPPKGGTGLGGTEEVVRPRVAFQTDSLRACYTPGRPPAYNDRRTCGSDPTHEAPDELVPDPPRRGCPAHP